MRHWKGCSRQEWSQLTKTNQKLIGKCLSWIGRGRTSIGKWIGLVAQSNQLRVTDCAFSIVRTATERAKWEFWRRFRGASEWRCNHKEYKQAQLLHSRVVQLVPVQDFVEQ